MPGLYAKTLPNGQTVTLYLDDATAQRAGLQPVSGGQSVAPPNMSPLPPTPPPPDQSFEGGQSIAPQAPPVANMSPAPPNTAPSGIMFQTPPMVGNGAGGSGGAPGAGPGGGGGTDTQAATLTPGGEGGSSPQSGVNEPRPQAKTVETRPLRDLLGGNRQGPTARTGGYGGKPIPAHDQRVAYEITRPNGIPEGDLAAMDEANRAYDASSTRVIQQKSNQDLAVASDLEAENFRLQNQLRQEEQRRASIDAEIGRRKYDIDAREAQAEKLSDTSEDTFWKEKGVAGEFAAAMAYTLGGYLQGVQGRATNPGADIVGAQIDRWVRSQRDKYERARGRVTDAQNAYKEAIDRWGTPEAAEADMRLRANALAEKSLQIRAAKMGIPVEQAQGLEVIGQRQAARAAARAQLEAQMAGTIAEKYMYIPTQYPGAGKPTSTKNLVMLRGQALGYVRNNEDFQPVQKGIDGMSVAVDEMDNVSQYLKDANVGPSEKKARAGAVAFRIARSLEQAEAQGVIREGEKDEIMKGLGSPDDWVNVYGQQRLQETQRYVEHKLQTIIGNHVMTSPTSTESVTGPLVNSRVE